MYWTHLDKLGFHGHIEQGVARAVVPAQLSGVTKREENLIVLPGYDEIYTCYDLKNFRLCMAMMDSKIL